MNQFWRKITAIIIGCLVISLFSFLVLSAPPKKKAPGKCGVERWPVKTVSDPDAKFLFKANGDLKSPRKKTIEDLSFLPFPFANLRGLPKSSYTSRVHPHEEMIVVVEATLTSYKREKDQDYHLVIEDDNGNSMIAEIVSPGCVASKNSQLTALLKQARQDFDAKFTATTKFKDTSTRVKITGVPFFDRPHDQKGAADNGIEIHPVLKIEF